MEVQQLTKIRPPKMEVFLWLMNKEQIPLITIPKRGLRVIPPMETQEKMLQVRNGDKISPFSEEEKYRLKKLINCKILEQRYPIRQNGEDFMNTVDLEWREELLEMAKELSDNIVNSWHDISALNDIAVLLYGSIAKGLTKKPTHHDPSNIDIAVIGSFSTQQRLDLYDAIRPKRLEIQERILDKCNEINSPEANPGNAGVTIQDIAKLKNNFYYNTRLYISSGGYALYDDSGIWQGIEQEAIDFARNNTTPRGKQL